jgi:fructose-1,6-bisphosphatase I
MVERDNTIITFEQHTLEEQRRHPGSTGTFAWLLSGITLATKIIQAKVRRAGLTDVLGEAGQTNVQGEHQQKLDVFSNNVLIHYLSLRDNVGILASEEDERPIILKQSADAKYIVVFDPLDGSSNIDVNVSVGTTFSILRRPHDPADRDDAIDILQPGYKQVAGGYVLYGSSTMLVYSTGSGVHGFTLDPAIGAYVLSHENIRMPEQGKWYSVNEAHLDSFPRPYQKFVQGLRSGALGKRYASRYIGSMVADIHRTLLKGGVFLYPPTIDNPRGKLRLMYEANPIAFLMEQAGGKAMCGGKRVLDIMPEGIHDRTAIICGGKAEMEYFERCVAEED